MSELEYVLPEKDETPDSLGKQEEDEREKEEGEEEREPEPKEGGE